MRRRLAAVGLAFIMGAGWSISTPADIPLPAPPKAKGDRCVEPTDLMRRNHMEFLLHQRDETVHRGIRTKKHSLVECLTCHTQTDAAGHYIPINAPGQFCQDCHAYSGVKMDCFECHATKPRNSASVHSKSAAMSGTSPAHLSNLARVVGNRP